MLMILAAIGYVGAVLALLLIAQRVGRAATAAVNLADRLESVLEDQGNAQPGTDPATVERLETLERRFEALAEDARKWYRKASQERRRTEAAFQNGDDDDAETPAALDQLRMSLKTPEPTGRRRLRRPR